MAEVTVTDPQNGNSAALNVGTQTPATSKGSDGNGVHVDGAGEHQCEDGYYLFHNVWC